MKAKARVALVVIVAMTVAASRQQQRPTFDSTTKLIPVHAQLSWVDYRGRKALTFHPLPGQEFANDIEMSAIVAGSDFKDGTIEVDVAGTRRDGYSADNVSGFKGFVGISFRVRGDSAERFYIRPLNARLEEQIFRNRSTQYEASPDYSWDRLRRESPGAFESYVDLEAGAWTHLRIEVSGKKAQMFVNGASQPALVVSDLKLGSGHGAIALWSRISAQAHFSNLKVTPK
jgi:hypothetical protein